MDATYYKISQIMALASFLLVTSYVFPVRSFDFNQVIRTLPPSVELRTSDELRKSDEISAHLQKINKPSVKVIQSPDGDVIDCVPYHLQPAFDHPLLKGKKPLDPPERPKGVNPNERVAENSQLWSSSGESCPEGTIPIRRTTEQDVLRASSIERFGRKSPIPMASAANKTHEHAVANPPLIETVKYYGAKATINLWAPLIAESDEFSLAQMWIYGGLYAPQQEINTIETGWQVYPAMYGDNNIRFFIYWTSDAYNTTGCYNLGCTGFVQTNNTIVIGGAITPVSSYMDTQYNISIYVWKDPTSGNWWLEYGSTIVGYWPSDLFTHLNNYADDIQFGGEITNAWPSGNHTSTQMGSGHLAEEGFGKAAYFSNLQGVDSNNNLVPVSNLEVMATNSNCYDIIPGNSSDADWGTYFYFGGPGRNANCT